MIQKFSDDFLKDLTKIMKSKRVGPEYILLKDNSIVSKLIFIVSGTVQLT